MKNAIASLQSELDILVHNLSIDLLNPSFNAPPGLVGPAVRAKELREAINLLSSQQPAQVNTCADTAAVQRVYDMPVAELAQLAHVPIIAANELGEITRVVDTIERAVNAAGGKLTSLQVQGDKTQGGFEVPATGNLASPDGCVAILAPQPPVLPGKFQLGDGVFFTGPTDDHHRGTHFTVVGVAFTPNQINYTVDAPGRRVGGVSAAQLAHIPRA